MIKNAIARLGARVMTTRLPLRILTNRANFGIWENAGFHITGHHFYEPIPDARCVDPRVWEPKTRTTGIDYRDEEQLATLQRFASCYRDEYESLLAKDSELLARIDAVEPGLGPVDAEVHYAMLRRVKPARVIEIGSGFSTLVAARALLANATETGVLGRLTAIEPYPSDYLRRGFPGLAELVTKKVQDVPVSTFSDLEPNDVVFIDSSHVLKLGSDVQHEFFEILPRIPKGVYVHFHDIFLPSEYPKAWVVDRHVFWNEQYILHAFLLHYSAFRVVWGSSYMHSNHPDELLAAFPSYDRRANWPGSFWIQRIA